MRVIDTTVILLLAVLILARLRSSIAAKRFQQQDRDVRGIRSAVDRVVPECRDTCSRKKSPHWAGLKTIFLEEDSWRRTNYGAPQWFSPIARLDDKHKQNA
jgi:hypothetical protein